MNAPGHRAERLAARIRTETEEMFSGEIADPRLESVTVTRVEVSPDYRHVRLWVMAPEEETRRREALAGLASARSYIRREISQRLRLRRAPEIDFQLDRDAIEARRVKALLNYSDLIPR